MRPTLPSAITAAPLVAALPDGTDEPPALEALEALEALDVLEAAP